MASIKIQITFKADASTNLPTCVHKLGRTHGHAQTCVDTYGHKQNICRRC